MISSRCVCCGAATSDHGFAVVPPTAVTDDHDNSTTISRVFPNSAPSWCTTSCRHVRALSR
jgi:hypothetical protein